LATRIHKRLLEEIEVERQHLELLERRVFLATFVFVAITSAMATVICVIKGYPWPVPSITSLASATSLIAGDRRDD
jgi:ABC-type spermidine/putrescine transport system permease subunit I